MHPLPMTFFITAAFCLIYIIYTRVSQYLKNKKIKENWPPVINPCPDFWVQSSDGKTCKNIKGIGELPANSVRTALEKGKTRKSDIKSACLWSIRHGTPWEGVDSRC